MRKFIPTLLTTLALLLATAPLYADGKKKGQTVEPQRVYLPEPDPVPTILRPETSQTDVTPISLEYTPIHYDHQAFTTKGGIDVSHYQGRIDWKAVKNSGRVTYAYVKATESKGLVDDTYAYNIREAHNAGIPVGCYHFFSSTTSAESQLENFISTVKLDGHDLVPMVDVEVRGKSSLSQFISRLRTFIRGIENHYHVKPIIYTSVNFYNNYLAGEFDDYIYMIARYAEQIPSPEGRCKFGMWQYSATGRVDGIRGAVDCSCFVDAYDLEDIKIKYINK